MKKGISLYLLLAILVLTSCMNSLPSPTPNVTATPSQTAQLLTATIIPSPIATGTVTPYPTFPTLGPEEAEKTIAEFMKGNNNCTTPCFWGLISGITSFHEAVKITNPLGPGDMWEDGVYDYDNRFMRNQINIEVLLSGTNDKLENIYASVYPLSEVKNEYWLAFRPDAILRAYGPPSKIGVFFVDTPFGQIVVFDLFYEYSNEDNFIFQFDSRIIKGSPATAHLCPLEGQQIDSFDLWLGKTDLLFGKNLHNPPQYDVISAKVMPLSPQEFYNRMTGDAKNACVDLNMKLVP